MAYLIFELDTFWQKLSIYFLDIADLSHIIKLLADRVYLQ